MYKGKKISVLIPAFNEEASIGAVIEELPRDIVDDIIVSDNASTDRTASLAYKKGARVVHEERRGYGAACLKALKLAAPTDIVVILDADHSDYPSQIERLVAPVADEEADIVIGSRTLGVRENGALLPQAFWGNKLAIFLIALFFGYKFSDMGPFRAVRYKSILGLNMQDMDFGWNAEMQIKAIENGLRIKEVPVDYRKRIGTSKISGTISGTLKAGAKIIYTIFKYAYKRKGVFYDRQYS